MTIDEIKNVIMNELSIELKNEPTFSEEILNVKVDNAIREVKSARHYPLSYTQEMIEADFEKFISNVKNIALYDYNQIGIEGQISSTELGNSRTYVDRNSLFRGVTPFAR